MRQKRTNLKEERFCKMCGKKTTHKVYCSQDCHYNDKESYSGENNSFYGKKHTEKTLNLMSQSQTKRFENPEEHEKSRRGKLKYYEEHPESKKQIGDKTRQYYIDNPEAREHQSEMKKEKWGDSDYSIPQREAINEAIRSPEGRKNASAGQLKSYAEKPERKINCSKGQKKRFENPLEHDKSSKALKKVYIDNPNLGAEIGDKLAQIYVDHPEKRKAASDRAKKQMSDPEMVKKALKRPPVTRLEKKFINWIDENEWPFYYNGNAKNETPFLIGTKIPDFVHISEKKIIEINGNRPHANPNMYAEDFINPYGNVAKDVWKADEERINFIKSQGFEVLIIWENELKDKQTAINKVNDFILSGGVI